MIFENYLKKLLTKLLQEQFISDLAPPDCRRIQRMVDKSKNDGNNKNRTKQSKLESKNNGNQTLQGNSKTTISNNKNFGRNCSTICGPFC